MKIRRYLDARTVPFFAITAFALTAGAAQLSGCSVGTDVPAPTYSSGTSSNSGVAVSNVTFHKDVEPILQKNCQKCHVSGGIAPFALMSFDDAKTASSDMVVATTEKIMPPWGAFPSSSCTPTHGFQEDLRLSAADIQTIANWDAAGDPEGDPKDAPPPITINPNIGLSGAAQSFKPAAPYQLTASSDQFRCFVLDPKITTTQYMNGTYVMAGNAQIVHHALVFSDAKRESLALITDKTNNSYDCFGGPGTSDPGLVAAWAPGGVPQEFPSNVGMEIDPGTLFVMQVHYHPHETVTSDLDTTTFQIRTVTAKPAYAVINQLLGNFTNPVGSDGIGLLPGPDDPPSGPEFLIPAGATAHTEEMEFTMPSSLGGFPLPDIYLYSVAAHQHYVATAQEITLDHTPAFLTRAPTTPQNECLLNVPNWNFNWQRFYTYAYDDNVIENLPRVGAGDQIHVKCTYDNTMDNTLLAESLTERQMNQPVDVKLGETTLDEMCLGAFSLVYKNP